MVSRYGPQGLDNINVYEGIAEYLKGKAEVVYAKGCEVVDAGWPDSVLLACVAAAVFCFIMSGMTHDKVNVDKYNREAEEESVREGRSVPHPTMSESDRFYSRLTGAICGVIMLLATVVALLMLFLGMAGSDVDAWMKVFWVPWPIGGVLCGVVGIIMPLVKEGRRR